MRWLKWRFLKLFVSFLQIYHVPLVFPESQGGGPLKDLGDGILTHLGVGGQGWVQPQGVGLRRGVGKKGGETWPLGHFSVAQPLRPPWRRQQGGDGQLGHSRLPRRLRGWLGPALRVGARGVDGVQGLQGVGLGVLPVHDVQNSLENNLKSKEIEMQWFLWYITFSKIKLSTDGV